MRSAVKTQRLIAEPRVASLPLFDAAERRVEKPKPKPKTIALSAPWWWSTNWDNMIYGSLLAKQEHEQ